MIGSLTHSRVDRSLANSDGLGLSSIYEYSIHYGGFMATRVW